MRLRNEEKEYFEKLEEEYGPQKNVEKQKTTTKPKVIYLKARASFST